MKGSPFLFCGIRVNCTSSISHKAACLASTQFTVLTKQAKHIVTTDLFLSFQILLINYKALQYDVMMYKTDFLYIVGFGDLNFIILTPSVICSETGLDADYFDKYF